MPDRDRQDQSEYPLIQTTKSGVRFVRPIDIIRSRAGLKIIRHQIAENEKPRRETPTIESGISETPDFIQTEAD